MKSGRVETGAGEAVSKIQVEGGSGSENPLGEGREKIITYMETNPMRFTVFGVAFNQTSIRGLASLFSSAGAFAGIYSQST